MSRFNVFFKNKLEQNNLSQNKFAKMIGVSSTYVGDMIKGRKGPPDFELQIKIADSLNIFGIERDNFFDKIAKEKDEIPSDIYFDIKNSNNWDEIRKRIKEK